MEAKLRLGWEGCQYDGHFWCLRFGLCQFLGGHLIENKKWHGNTDLTFDLRVAIGAASARNKGPTIQSTIMTKFTNNPRIPDPFLPLQFRLSLVKLRLLA